MINIYALKDNGSIFYIGKCKDVKKRMAAHIRGSLDDGSPKSRRIAKILSEGRLPELEILKICEDYDGLEQEKKMIAFYVSKGADITNIQHNKYPTLNEIERKVLHCLDMDMDTIDIARVLYRSPRTIEAIRQRIKEKANRKTLTGLMQWAYSNELLAI
jgi:DNA-binding NarL/FixJ family response regulator